LLRAELPCIFEHSGRDDEDAVDDLLPLVAGEQVNAELNLSCCAAVHQSFDVKGFGRRGALVPASGSLGPTRRDIDAPLIAGSILLGAGWDLVG
jgi:hypothetical protein